MYMQVQGNNVEKDMKLVKIYSIIMVILAGMTKLSNNLAVVRKLTYT